MQKDDDVGKVAQATPVVICTFIVDPFPSNPLPLEMAALGWCTAISEQPPLVFLTTLPFGVIILRSRLVSTLRRCIAQSISCYSMFHIPTLSS